MRWVDYLYSPEGGFIFNNGPEGLLWERNEDGIPVPTEEGAEGGEDRRGEVTPNYGITTPGGGYEAEEEWTMYNEDRTFRDFIESETYTKFAPNTHMPFPNVYLPQEQLELIQDLNGDIQTYLETAEAEFITGARDINDDADWDDYVSTLESIGVDQWVEVYQDLYDEFIENFGEFDPVPQQSLPYR